mgnify:CR=1 FL=1
MFLEVDYGDDDCGEDSKHWFVNKRFNYCIRGYRKEEEEEEQEEEQEGRTKQSRQSKAEHRL